MRTIILGGTGFIGRALALLLAARGEEVVVPSRRPEKAAAVFAAWAPPARIRPAPFDGGTGAGWADFLEPGCAVVNLAGANIAAGRWTPEVMRRIEGSRLSAGAAVMDALARAAARGVRPAVLAQGSAVGYYGPRGREPVDEAEPRGQGFLAQVAAAWEASTAGAEALGVRRVVLRTSMVLGPGGALAKMLPAFRLGLGGPLGPGTQMVPCIHLDDEVGAIAHLLDRPETRGPYNLVIPEAPDSRGFARALGRALGRPAFLPAPAFALRLLFGQMAEEVLLSGVNASAARLLASGYAFRYPTPAAALEAAIAPG